MPEVELKALFNESRYPSGWKAVALTLYFPVGIIFAVLRFFIGLQALMAASFLPQLSLVRIIVLRLMCMVLGIFVKQEDSEKKDRAVLVIVTNHITPIDHLAIHLVTNCITPSLWEIPGPLSWSLGVRDFGSKQGRDTLIKNLQLHLERSQIPILLHPEGATTNGNIGLLKFSSWPFALGRPVQPVVIRIWRPPITEVTPAVLCSNWWTDMFWFLFVPFSIFSLKYLPVMSKKGDEPDEEFAARVQEAMAKDLQIQATKYTHADKAEYLKRYHMEQKQSNIVRPPVTHPQPSPELLRMAKQVNEVLPYVPRDVVLRDLARTKNVDITISNILEGLVPYVPEVDALQSSNIPSTSQPSSSSAFCAATSPCPPQPPSSQISVEKSPSNSSSSDGLTSGPRNDSVLDTSSPVFPKTAQERMLSFQERKTRLIENARRRYIEKHGLKIAGYNS